MVVLRTIWLIVLEIEWQEKLLRKHCTKRTIPSSFRHFLRMIYLNLFAAMYELTTGEKALGFLKSIHMLIFEAHWAQVESMSGPYLSSHWSSEFVSLVHDSEVLESELPGVTVHLLYSSASNPQAVYKGCRLSPWHLSGQVWWKGWRKRGGKFIGYDSQEK